MNSNRSNTETGSSNAARKSRKGLKITPHKGGRTERFEARLTPEEKRMIVESIKNSGLSAADWLIQIVQQAPR